MQTSDRFVSWVVYQMTTDGNLPGVYAVCEQTEWDALEQVRPGYHRLIQDHIPSEQEAERVAREAPGGTAPGKIILKSRL